MVSDPVSESIVSAVNQVGHAMNLKTVAEFVETEQIQQKLLEIGVDFSQGFWIGKPAPFSELFASKHQSLLNDV